LASTARRTGTADTARGARATAKRLNNIVVRAGGKKKTKIVVAGGGGGVSLLGVLEGRI
jgi:hypothetical protein